MPFLKYFKEDIFISYAHVDNRPLIEGHKGWVTEFHSGLKVKLGQFLEGEPGLFHDESKLRGNDYVDDTISSRLTHVAIFISVLTPRFVNSNYCLKELREFCMGAEQNGGVRLGDKSRIFKVVKTPVSPDKHPPELRSLAGYEFYQVDPDTGVPRELAASLDSKTSYLYWMKLEDLAYDIHQTMEEIDLHIKNLKVLPGDVATRAEAAGVSPVATVYLAETTLDLHSQRDSIRRELQQRGYRVLPEKLSPLSADDYKAAVREDLRRSSLSVHLIGANYGIIPEAAESSVISLQNELASERSHDPNFMRIIWMPPGLETHEERQRLFIETLRNDSNAQHGAELLQTTVEDLKTIIQDKLTTLTRPAPSTEVAADDAPCRIYLVHDPRDFEQVKPIYDYLFDEGYEVLTPLMEGDEARVYANHKENLLLCDAVVIYCGDVSEDWVKTKQGDLFKLPGLGRTKPLHTKAFYVVAPATPFKERFRTHEALVIRQPAEFTPKLLQPLLAQLATMKGAQ